MPPGYRPAREQRVLGFMAQIPDSHIICRGGGRHDFPSDRLDPRKKSLPKGMTARMQRGGQCEITDTCTRCGKVRRYVLDKGILFGSSARYRYRNPKDWKKAGRDSGITRRDFRAEQIRRSAELIAGLALPVREEED